MLTVGGHDPSGGAGITADVRTAAACGCPAVSVLTALTLQGPGGVRSTMPLPAARIRREIALLARETPAVAAKTGMLATAAIVRAVARAVDEQLIPAPVVDPVLDASSGFPLLDDAGRRALVRDLIPRARVVTPNIREASLLTGVTIGGLEGMAESARRLVAMGARAVVVTGGHLPGRPADLILERGRVTVLSGTRLRGRMVHGLGCAFSMALACRLADGAPLPAAARGARRIVRRLIAGAWGGGGRGMRLPGLVRSTLVVLALAGAFAGCSGDPSQRIEGLFRARAKGHDTLLAAAVRAADDRDHDVRANAAWMLAETGDSGVVPTLVKLLGDDAPDVRAAAAAGLARLGGSVDPAVVVPLTRDADPSVRLQAVRLLSAGSNDSALPALLEATGDSNSEVRMAAVDSLVAVPAFPALPELARCLLSDTAWKVRQAALRALAARPEEEARSLLEIGAADANPLVRGEATDAIRAWDAASRRRQEEAAATAMPGNTPLPPGRAPKAGSRAPAPNAVAAPKPLPVDPVP